MANDSFKVKKSLNIEPVASASPTAKGDIVYDSTSDTVKYYNGSSRTVVNTDEAQSLSNKTLASPTFSGTVTSGLTASRALATGASGELAASSVTSTELGYVSGVTSAIQTQLGNKVASTSGTLTSPTVTNEITQAHTSTPSAPASGYMKIYPKSDGKYYTLDSSSVETQLGSGGSGKNYLQSVFDGAAVTGFTAYADAAASVPVDMTGGSPNADLTFAASASSPLTGTSSILFTHTANNRQGSGWSATISLDVSDRGKVLAFSMNYAIASGTYASGDLVFYAYDVTNSTLIQPTPYSILNHSLGSDRFFAELQTSSSTASLQIGFHVATSTATAYTMKMDDMVFGPQAKLYGSVATDWTSYTPTFVGAGSPTITYGRYRRVGTDVELDVKMVAGTPTAVPLSMSLPGSITPDPFNTGVRSVGWLVKAAATEYSLFPTIINTATGNLVYFGGAAAHSAAKNPLSLANGDAVLSAGDTVVITARFPITGWSTSQVLSDSADTRVVAAVLTGSPATATSGNPIIFPTITNDTHGAYNSTTGRYTVATPGYYQLVAGGAVTAGTAARLQIYKNASLHSIIGFVNSTDGLFAASGLVSCIAGDVIDLRPNATVAGPSANSSMSIYKLGGPAQIAASEKVGAVILGNPASATSGNPIIVPTVSYDSHGGYNASTGRYTVPRAGLVKVFGALASASSATTLSIYKNASLYSLAGNLDSNGEATFSGMLYCVAGDIVDIRPGGTVDATDMSLCFEMT